MHKHKNQLDTIDLEPGFTKWNKPLKLRARTRSARPKEEIVACSAKKQVVIEVNRVIENFIPFEDELEKKICTNKQEKVVRDNKWRLKVLDEDDRTTKEASDASQRARSVRSAAIDTIAVTEVSLLKAAHVTDEIDDKIQAHLD